ncbi:hypothetical protein HELRODRAFT_185410 [Helobdella robusta]|uniref:WW domain-containing oxidoreductase n=1 Tax=Helobdella robusta TaxID=6412 RepID=T1FMS1_HELRO|nr:hypothetical protein HELRODRAFT_185410 [Helobdella robusta]ESO07953.1 hypothetical protein HELRODRAFT_185410 [Helobdella robusta]
MIDTDSEDELPPGWEEKLSDEGKIYYVDHNHKVTQWEHPKSGHVKRIAQELPYGWTKEICHENGNEIFKNSRDNKTSLVDPRLAYPISDNENIKQGSFNLNHRYDGSTTAFTVLQSRDLTGTNVIVTGGNSGIGFETARALACFGADVVIACRNMKSANLKVCEIRKECKAATISSMMLNLCRLISVEKFAQAYKQKYKKLHILIINAGIFWLPYDCTPDGYERTFQTNYLGHFYLIRLLRSLLFTSAPCRIVFLTSESHRFSDLNSKTICESILSPTTPDLYHPILNFNISKLCLTVLCYELHRRWYHYGIGCFAVHPGNLVNTNICRYNWLGTILMFLAKPFSKTAEQGAATAVYCATSRDLNKLGGMYFINCIPVDPLPDVVDLDLALSLWQLSRNMVAKAATLSGCGGLGDGFDSNVNRMFKTVDEVCIEV